MYYTEAIKFVKHYLSVVFVQQSIHNSVIEL